MVAVRLATLRKIPNFEKSETPPFAEIPDLDSFFALTQNLNSSLPKSKNVLIPSFLILIYLPNFALPIIARLNLN